MIRIRVKRIKHKSLTVGTTIFNDDRVSLFARGLFCTALALAQNKGYEMSQLLDAVPDDTDDVYRGIMELRKFGYCKRVKVEGETEFLFREVPLRKASRVQNKSPLIYSKSMAQVGLPNEQVPKQSRDLGHEDSEFEDWDEIDPLAGQQEMGQPSFLPERVKKSRPKAEPVPAVSHRLMQRICFLVETEAEALTLTSSDRGRIASALGRLRDLNADLAQLNHFEVWWTSQWRSRDRLSNVYNPPTPEQVVQFWVQAMKHGKYKPEPVAPKEPKHIETNLTEVMRRRAESRNE